MSNWPADPTVEQLREQERHALDDQHLSAQSPEVQAIRGERMVVDPVGGPLMGAAQKEKLRAAYFALFPSPTPGGSPDRLALEAVERTLRQAADDVRAVLTRFPA